MRKTLIRKIAFLVALMGGIAPVFLSACYAQREVLYEQYSQNPMAINPAFTGVREDFNMSVLLRRRWFLIPNAPITQTFAMDGTLAGGKIGLGLQALNDRMSPFFTTGVYGSAAYHWDASVAWKVSLGMQGGINVLPVYDFATNTSQNRALGSVGAGIWIHSDRFYLGVSKPELLSQGYGGRQTGFQYRQPLFITAGATLQTTDKLQFIPSLLVVQEKGSKLRVDIGSRLWFDEKIGLGASYRMAQIDYFQLSAEAQVSRNIRLGYIFNSRAIESGIVGISNNPISLHEIMLKFIPSPTGFHIN